VKLPNREEAIVPEAKITLYLLNTDHPRGKDKATFFSRFGFSGAQWEVLRDALLAHATVHEVASTLETPEGIHYAIEGAIDTDSTTPRFITAYPVKSE
jgi:hypothetical protein